MSTANRTSHRKSLATTRPFHTTIHQHAPAPIPQPAKGEPTQPQIHTRLHALPAQNRDFVGREDDITKIRAALAKGGAVITAIEGMGGIGKTAVGVEVANKLRDEGLFPDGVPFVDLEGFSATREPLSTKEALEALLRPMVGAEAQLPEEDQALQQLWKQQTADCRMLLFLDNARDEVQIRPLLPGHPGCKVLATSRHRLNLDGIEPIKLDVMEQDKATDLAYTLGNRWQQGRLSHEQAAELARLCGYLPLPIKVTAAALGKAPLLNVETQLQKLAQVGRDALGMDEVKAVLAQSLDQLTPELRAAWQKLGVFEGDFSAAAAAAIISDDSADEMLAELEQRHLLTLSNQQRLQLHDILRALALQPLPADEREIVEACHATHYKDVLASARDLYNAGKVLDGLQLYDHEQHQILAGQSWAAEHVADSEEIARLAADYADAGVNILSLRLTPHNRIEWLTIQLGVSRMLHDQAGEFAALGNLGIAYQNLGEMNRAIELFKELLEASRKSGSRLGEGKALNGLGAAYLGLSDAKSAINALEKRLEIARETRDRRGEGVALGGLGNAYRSLGETGRAIEFHKQYLEIARGIGDRLHEGTALNNLGGVYSELGETKCAIEVAEEALSIFHELGAKRLVEQVEGNLAQLKGETAAE